MRAKKIPKFPTLTKAKELISEVRQPSQQSIVDFVKGNGNKITVGKFEIRELGDGSFFFEHETGEGTQVQRVEFEALITKFYRDMF